jgi:hypothetical protein
MWCELRYCQYLVITRPRVFPIARRRLGIQVGQQVLWAG